MYLDIFIAQNLPMNIVLVTGNTFQICRWKVFLFHFIISYNIINNSFLAKIYHKGREIPTSKSTILVRNNYTSDFFRRQNSDSYFCRASDYFSDQIIWKKISIFIFLNIYRTELLALTCAVD